MKINEFCLGREVDSQAVRKYIDRHPDVFGGHTQKIGREIDLDEAATEILEKQYPLPRPIELIPDTESLEKLIQAQELIISMSDRLLCLQQENGSLREAKALGEANKLLLEDKTEQLQKLELENQNLKVEFEKMSSSRKEVLDELEHIKNRTLWQRIFDK